MSKNIGWSKKWAEGFAKSCRTSGVDAYAQKEDHWYHGVTSPKSSHQWVVVLQKRPTPPLDKRG